MSPHTQQSPSIPPPPPFFFATDLEDGEEVDVDLDADDEDQGAEHDPVSDDTIIEQIEIVGEGYVSLAAYFVSQLEEFVDPSIEWILCCLDMRLVQRRFEGSTYRYGFENGTVFRASAKAAPKPPPGDDPPGPFLPTRGGV